MNNQTDDQEWLDTLGGKRRGEQATTASEIEAQALRNAFFRKSQSRPVYATTEAHFQRILAEAKNRGLLRARNQSTGRVTLLGAIYEFLTAPAAVMASAALICGLTITVGWQAHEMNAGEDTTVRGEISAGRVSLIVESPVETAKAWQKDLLEACIEHSVSFEAPNRILIRIKLSPAAVELLEKKRISPPNSDRLTLVIDSAKVR